ncbi:unnamed protein product [Boreogadus saida]
MEDMVIVSVCARPILYDTTMESYRDRNKKELAWVDVAEETGLPGSKRKRATRVPCGQDPIQEAILQALHNEAAQTPPPPQLSEDAFFVQSILPSLERLPRQACAELKFEGAFF